MVIGFIGGGQMARALAVGFAQSDASLRFAVADPSDDACEDFASKLSGKCERFPSNLELAQHSQIVFLAVKPQIMETALAGFDKMIWPEGTIVVSVAAGISIRRLVQLTGNQLVLRLMPNTPCLIGEGAMGLAADESISPEQIELVSQLCQSVGVVEFVSETQMDAVTGLSGSGPAYVFRMIEAMIDSAEQLDLPRDVAKTLAVQTVLGAARLVKETGEEPSLLRQRVTSPNGTTMEGLRALDEKNFDAAIRAAINAAADRSKELSQ